MLDAATSLDSAVSSPPYVASCSFRAHVTYFRQATGTETLVSLTHRTLWCGTGSHVGAHWVRTAEEALHGTGTTLTEKLVATRSRKQSCPGQPVPNLALGVTQNARQHHPPPGKSRLLFYPDRAGPRKPGWALLMEAHLGQVTAQAKALCRKSPVSGEGW